MSKTVLLPVTARRNPGLVHAGAVRAADARIAGRLPGLRLMATCGEVVLEVTVVEDRLVDCMACMSRLNEPYPPPPPGAPERYARTALVDMNSAEIWEAIKREAG